jgi:preprotein translocase subunit SecA
MFGNILKSFSGRHYRKFLKACDPLVEKINAIEQEYQSLSEEQLRAKTDDFRARIEKNREAVRERLGPEVEPDRLEAALRERDKESLEELLPEAFAAVKNAARKLCGRTVEFTGQEQQWNMVHYDVQLKGGMALHHGMISEMQTGEGKTLVSTCPLYLNALTGKNVHLVTVNEYLARRDAEWMGHIFKMLGLTVGVIRNQQPPPEKREAYHCDLTYGTASEFGFDYLRDNGMASRAEDQVQREHYFCIIDEVDSILIDEARTPLIISGPMQEDNPLPFTGMKPIIQKIVRAQEKLCTQLVTESRKILGNTESQEEEDSAYLSLLQVRWGMPKNKQLLRMMENPEYRKKLEKWDLEMTSDFQKERKYELKEELYFQIDEKQQQADLTEKGRQFLAPGRDDAFLLPDLPEIFSGIEKDSSLSPEEKQQRKQQEEEKFQKTSEEIHTISQLLRAYCLYEKDKEYVVQDGKVMIVDENTGRLMPGRRWSDGLHQAVESKEGVAIEKETKTYATITIQNYFRLYEKLAGMTGTAETEAGEFLDIYRMKVMVVPTHKPNVRLDDNDVVWKTRREKYNAALEDIREAHGKGQPVLVGTASVEASEVLSRMLKRSNIPHTVLNAKFHQQEAEIVARAGQRGAVTIATNMAGRGTDIKLGEGVPDLGGLLVLGTERHESRRIDRQLRGRCARQGDPGRTKFFISLEDDLMRLFANAGKISTILEKSFVEGEELQHPLLNWSIENAQKKVEQQNYSIRKRLLQYDDVLNKQREVIYGIRNEAIVNDNPKAIILEMVEEEIEERLGEYDWEGNQRIDATEAFLGWINTAFPIGLKTEDLEGKSEREIYDLCLERIRAAYENKEELEDSEALLLLQRAVVVRPIDRHWQDHLTEMEELRRAVGLRGYGQKDPLSEYKSEAFKYFEQMMNKVRSEIASGFFRTASNLKTFQNMLALMSQRAKVEGPAEGQSFHLVGSAAQAAHQARMEREGAQGGGAGTPGGPDRGAPQRPLPKVEPIRREMPKIGRNELVTIRRGGESKQMKFKKAEVLIENEGWVLDLEHSSKS